LEEGARTTLAQISQPDFLCPECGSGTTTCTGFVVCKGCGLTLDREYVSGTFQLGGTSGRSNPSQYLSLGDRPGLVDGMGSNIGRQSLSTLWRFNTQQRVRIHALRKEQLRTRRTDETLFRVLSEINYICSILGLPRIVQQRATFLLKKARRQGCRGMGFESYSLAVVCMTIAARENEVPVTSREIADAFKVRFHKIGLCTRRRVAWWIGEHLGIKAMVNSPLVYLPRIISAIRNSPEVRERLGKKLADLDIERFSIELEIRARETLTTLRFRDKGSKRPFSLAASVCYSMAFHILKKRVLTMDVLSRACGVPIATIRDHHNMWKRVLAKEMID